MFIASGYNSPCGKHVVQHANELVSSRDWLICISVVIGMGSVVDSFYSREQNCLIFCFNVVKVRRSSTWSASSVTIYFMNRTCR